jgi:hypothetical protein
MRHLFVAATLLATPLFADEIPGTTYTTGFWTGAAQTDDRGGFSHCTLSIGYTNGETLWLGLYRNDSLSVLLTSPNVRFTPGETFDAWMMTEIGLPTKGVAEAWDEGFAGMTLTGIQPSIDFLVQGRYLRILGIGIDDSYDIQGIAEGLALAKACVDTQMRGAAPPPPKVPDLKPKPAPGAGGGLGTRPGKPPGLGTPAPKPAP